MGVELDMLSVKILSVAQKSPNSVDSFRVLRIPPELMEKMKGQQSPGTCAPNRNTVKVTFEEKTPLLKESSMVEQNSIKKRSRNSVTFQVRRCLSAR